MCSSTCSCIEHRNQYQVFEHSATDDESSDTPCERDSPVKTRKSQYQEGKQARKSIGKEDRTLPQGEWVVCFMACWLIGCLVFFVNGMMYVCMQAAIQSRIRLNVGIANLTWLQRSQVWNRTSSICRAARNGRMRKTRSSATR